MDRNSISTWVGRVTVVLAIAVALLLGAGPSLAQVDTGSILGTVSDTSGATVSGAKVVLLNQGTGAALTSTTSADGAFKFSPVRIGSYTLTVTFQGFQTSTQKDIPVNVGSDVVSNFTLQPGKVSEIIEVTGAAPVLQSQDASVGQIADSADGEQPPAERPQLYFPCAAGCRCEHAAGRHARKRGERSIRRQRFASRAEQLPARWHRQQLGHGGLPERHQLRRPASG